MITLNEVQKLPLAADVEVLVVGGGPAGVGAAFSAARLGADTLIVEQFNCLGGIATAGGHGHICIFTAWADAKLRIVGGISYEMAQRIDQMGYGQLKPGDVDFEIEGMKLALDQMAEECDCKLLYYTHFADTVVQDGKAIGIVIQNKTGRQFIRAKRIVDCTGDGDVAARADCGYEKGAPDSGLCQPMTLMFTIGGVEWPRVTEWRKTEQGGLDYKMQRIWKEAQDNGDMRPFQNQIMGFWWTPTRPDQVGINFTHITHLDCTRAEDLTAATIEGRKQAYESIDVFRKYVPGMEKCYMVSTPNTVGTRESRRIHGDYTLTKEDLMAEKEFDDSIGYGSFFIDIHSVSGPGMDNKTYRPHKGFKYQIPYGIIVPKDVDNLLVAGRCASADHEALGSLRVMPQCTVMGHAAGAASQLSLQDGTVPRDIDIAQLQDTLRKQKAIVTAQDIVEQ
ncbi:MAG: FAD-dependent oxidoreductase [Candidatus Sumerlaeota bacterium]